jgi:hypothetical protein
MADLDSDLGASMFDICWMVLQTVDLPASRKAAPRQPRPKPLGVATKLTAVSWEICGDPDPQTAHFDFTVYWQLA